MEKPRRSEATGQYANAPDRLQSVMLCPRAGQDASLGNFRSERKQSQQTFAPTAAQTPIAPSLTLESLSPQKKEEGGRTGALQGWLTDTLHLRGKRAKSHAQIALNVWPEVGSEEGASR